MASSAASESRRGGPAAGVKALAFDVFGTVVDWRGSIIEEGRVLGRRLRIQIDWAAFADAWRAGYAPAMDRVRRGELHWTNIDALHRLILGDLLVRFGIEGLGEPEVDQLNRVWHRLIPWPDSCAGLQRLKQKYVIATLSNGNIALLVNLSKHAGLPWDAVLSAELFQHYKPDPQTYLGAAQLLGLRPQELLLVAAHKRDLDAAARCGLRTAFVTRPLEYGERGRANVTFEPRFDLHASDLLDLAKQLGC